MIFQDHVLWPNPSAPAEKVVGSKVDLTQVDQSEMLRKEFLNKVGNRWPVVIKFHPRKIKSIPDPDAPGQVRIERPPEYNVTLEWTATGMDGRRHTYTYCENYDIDPEKKKNKYFPTVISLDGGYREFQKKDLEFLMWLYLCFPNLEGGKNESKSLNDIVFDLPWLDKMEKDNFNSLYSEVLALISNPKFSKPMPELRKLLTAYFVPNVDKMEDFEVREALTTKATEGKNNAEKVESMKLFLDRGDNTEFLRSRFLCQKAIEIGMIKYDPKRRTFNMIMDGRPIDPPLCVIAPDEGARKEAKLADAMVGLHPDDLKLIENTLSQLEKDKSKKDKED